MARLASVYPLVTARALARPFTYEVPDEVQEGAVVEVRLGGARQRGVVVETGVEAPRGVEAAPVGRTVDSIPPALVELALWIADYYGSTPSGTSYVNARATARAVTSGTTDANGIRPVALRRVRGCAAS